MDWAFVILIVGAMAYAGFILMEYTNRSIAMRPAIAKLEKVSLGLLEEHNEEDSRQGERRGRIEGLRLNITELSRTQAALNRDMQVARTRRQRLEIEYYKLQLKGKLRKAAA